MTGLLRREAVSLLTGGGINRTETNSRGEVEIRGQDWPEKKKPNFSRPSQKKAPVIAYESSRSGVLA